jgi:hypothetical protein
LLKLATDLKLPKLTFQVIRRTIATLAQKKGTVKDVQGVLRHSRSDHDRRLYATDPEQGAGDGRFYQRGVEKKVKAYATEKEKRRCADLFRIRKRSRLDTKSRYFDTK